MEKQSRIRETRRQEVEGFIILNKVLCVDLSEERLDESEETSHAYI